MVGVVYLVLDIYSLFFTVADSVGVGLMTEQ